jgi:arsenate reductase (thioredoxin)
LNPSREIVLFACVHNAGRSQIAAAWFNLLADATKAQAISAGTEPGTRVHPAVVESMHEVGVDLSDVTPRFLSDELAAASTLLVTMGCGEVCPVVPGVERCDWPLEDPKGKSIERVREIREEIRERVVRLLESRGWNRGTGPD